SRLILIHVLLQHVQKSLGLLWADVNPLKILNRNLVRGSLIDAPGQQQEIPQIHANLDAVCIVLAIFRRISELDLRSGRLRHSYRVPSQIAAKAVAGTVDAESYKEGECECAERIKNLYEFGTTFAPLFSSDELRQNMKVFIQNHTTGQVHCPICTHTVPADI